MIYKAGLITIISISLASGRVAAADINDCAMVSTTGDMSALASGLNMVNQRSYEAIIPSAAISKAFEHLKKFCCQNGNISLGCESYKGADKGYPQSTSLYDQLIDVSLRRLDGVPAISYGLSSDPTGAAWRTFISEASAEANGTTAKSIMDQYTQYRSEQSKDPTSIVEQYNNPAVVSLADKYLFVCTAARNIYAKIPQNNISETQHFVSSCQANAKQRKDDEYIFTKSLMIKKSNELLHETTKSFSQTYFVKEKMGALIDLIHKIKSLFTTMVQQAAASIKCSK